MRHKLTEDYATVNIILIFLLEAVMDQFSLDALLLPLDSRGPADETGSNDGINTGIISNAGLPAIVILAGYTSEPVSMPVGMKFVGRQFAEATLIKMGYAFEKKGQGRIPPHL